MCFRPPTLAKPQRCACGIMNPPNAKQCRKCGAALEGQIETFICPRCGSQNPLTATACVKCGLSAEEAAAYKGSDE